MGSLRERILLIVAILPFGFSLALSTTVSTNNETGPHPEGSGYLAPVARTNTSKSAEETQHQFYVSLEQELGLPYDIVEKIDEYCKLLSEGTIDSLKTKDGLEALMGCVGSAIGNDDRAGLEPLIDKLQSFILSTNSLGSRGNPGIVVPEIRRTNLPPINGVTRTPVEPAEPQRITIGTQNNLTIPVAPGPVPPTKLLRPIPLKVKRKSDKTTNNPVVTSPDAKKKVIIALSPGARSYLYNHLVTESGLLLKDITKIVGECKLLSPETIETLQTPGGLKRFGDCVITAVGEGARQKLDNLIKKLPNLFLSIVLLAPHETPVNEIGIELLSQRLIVSRILEEDRPADNRVAVGIYTSDELTNFEGVRNNLGRLLVRIIPGLFGLTAVVKAPNIDGNITFLGDSADEVGIGRAAVNDILESARPIFTLDGFKKLAEAWGTEIGSPKYWEEFFVRYGLHKSTDAEINNIERNSAFKRVRSVNASLPMGLTETTMGALKNSELTSLSKAKVYGGVTVTCVFCHSTYIHKKYAPGVQNVFANLQRLTDDLVKVGASTGSISGYLINPKHNSIVTSAHTGNLFGARLYEFSESKKGLVSKPLNLLSAVPWLMTTNPVFDRTAPWYNFGIKVKNKVSFYYDGSADPEKTSVITPTLLPNYMGVGVSLEDTLNHLIASYEKPIQKYLATLQPPIYPGKVDNEKVLKGKSIYANECLRCHGLENYQGLLRDVGTDPNRKFSEEQVNYLNKVQGKAAFKVTGNYVAPPLQGIWVRAPYLHNGSVPTLKQLLSPVQERMACYVVTSDPREEDDYDYHNVGWNVEACPKNGSKYQTVLEQNPSKPVRIYDPKGGLGLSNQGHEHGVSLSDADKENLLEFLKTL